MKVVVYGFEGCPGCERLKEFLAKHQINYTYKDIDDPEVKAEQLELAKEQISEGKRGSPTIVVDGIVKTYPDDAWLVEHLGIKSENSQEIRPLAIVGAGPAALSAAIYTARENIDTTLIEKGAIGGLAAITDWVDNYPGFADGIEGLKLSDAMRAQAERFGAKIELNEVTGVEKDGDNIKIKLVDGEMTARAVLIATGSDYRKIGVPGEQEYYARGVHYCATCDGAFYREKRLVVVGGGNSAVQESLFLTRFASHIDLLVRSKLRASDVLIKELEKNSDKITVHLATTTDEIVGKEGKVTKVVGTDTVSGKKVDFECDGVFIFVGLDPNTGFLGSSGIELDEQRFVASNADLMTNIKGVFVAGDVRSGATMQIASATGEGATAALKIREYLDHLGE